MSAVPYLDNVAWEGSTFPVKVSFFEPDANGVDQPVLPNTVTWSLYEVVNDTVGNVINSRLNVTITPGETVTIILHGADLVIPSKAIFQLEVKAVYDSVLYGDDKELVQAVRFRLYKTYSQ